MAVILTEEITEEAYIGGSNEAEEGEDKGVNRDHLGVVCYFRRS